MPAKNSLKERKINSKNSYVEGSVKLENGDFIGGNKITGIDPKDLLEFLSNNFTLKYQHPKELSTALHEFKNYHQALYEWKELHNNLDVILNSFDPFYSHIQGLKNTPRKAIPADLMTLWFPPSKRIDELTYFSREIKLIGKPFKVTENKITGEKWAVDFFNLKNQMDFVLDTAVQAGNHIFHSISWWDRLYELTGIIHNSSLSHMHIGDKKLRETAMELYNLSERVFRGD